MDDQNVGEMAASWGQNMGEVAASWGQNVEHNWGALQAARIMKIMGEKVSHYVLKNRGHGLALQLTYLSIYRLQSLCCVACNLCAKRAHTLIV